MTGSAFIIGDLFLTLIQHGKKVSLAVCKSTALVHDGSRVTEIGAGTIGNAQGNVKLTGQILHLQSVPTTTDDTDTADDPTETSPLEGSLTWLWLGTFLTGTSKMKDTDILTTKPITLTVPGIMVELVNPTVVDAHGRLPAECVKGINSSGTTWAFHDAALRVLVVKLSLRLNDGSNLRALPNVKQVSPAFPYKNSSGGFRRQNQCHCAKYSFQVKYHSSRTKAPLSSQKSRRAVAYTVRRFPRTGALTWAATFCVVYATLGSRNPKERGAPTRRHWQLPIRVLVSCSYSQHGR
jgi:hypothetical protein